MGQRLSVVNGWQPGGDNLAHSPMLCASNSGRFESVGNKSVQIANVLHSGFHKVRFKLAVEGISLQLGDMIDDHCSRCKRTTDHAIVAMTGDDVVKVVCRTCNSEHKYRHNKTGKKEMTPEQAFQKVLASVTGQMGEPSAGAAKKKKR